MNQFSRQMQASKSRLIIVTCNSWSPTFHSGAVTPSNPVSAVQDTVNAGLGERAVYTEIQCREPTQGRRVGLFLLAAVYVILAWVPCCRALFPCTSDLASSVTANAAAAGGYYAFRDHFLLVGPPANPANISNTSSISVIFSEIHEAAESDNVTEPPVRFLSRYDKSATNIKETLLWAGIGQVGPPGRNHLLFKP